MSALPEKWTRCEIGEATKIVSGGTPPSKDSTNFTSEGGIPWITPADLSGYKDIYIRRGARNLTEKGLRSCSATVIPEGSVLFSSRAPVGYVAIAANELTTNQGFKSFVPPTELDSCFLFFYLRHIKPIAEEMATGTTFKELSGSTAARLPLLIAPFSEQKRIAEKLVNLLTRVDSCQSHLDRISQILKRFRQAILDAAISGRLTENWREKHPSLPDWQQTNLGSVASVGTGTTPSRTNLRFFSNSGIPWITSAATREPYITIAQEFITPEAIAAYRMKVYPIGTLIVAMYGEGKTRGQVSELAIEATVNQACATIIVDTSKVLSRYVKLALQASYSKIREMSGGAAQPNLNLGKIKGLTFPLPSLDEQEEIVKQSKALLEYADRLESRYQAVAIQIKQITPSLLAKAFRGELVSQNPEDEPAEKLLERIRAEQATLVPVRKPRQRTDMKPSKTNKETAKPISLVQALIDSGKELSGSDLLIAAGYPNDGDSDKIEEFFVAVRDALKNNQITKIRRKDEDWFSLTQSTKKAKTK